MNIEIISAIISSSFITALITSFFNKKAQDKEHLMNYVVQERKQWRDFIRKKSIKFISLNEISEKQKILYQMQIRLNPDDSMDNKIIDIMEKYIEPGCILYEKDFIKEISKLLKEDWERVKREVSIKSNNLIRLMTIVYFYISYFLFTMFYELKFISKDINMLIHWIFISLSFFFFTKVILQFIVSNLSTSNKTKKIFGVDYKRT